jgi:hypothetical protein
VDKEAEVLERMLRACRDTIEDVRAGHANLYEDALPDLERLCAELEAMLSEMLGGRAEPPSAPGEGASAGGSNVPASRGKSGQGKGPLSL